MNDSLCQAVVARNEMSGGLAPEAAKFAALFDQPAVGIAEATVDGRFIRANARFGEIVGRDPESLAGLHIRDITHPDDAEVNIERFKRLVEEGEPFFMEKRYVRPDGSIAWVQVYGSPVRSSDGRIDSAVAVAIDVTGRRKSEGALRESESRFREVADAAPVLIWLADTENKGIWYNKAWLDFTGRSMEQDLGDGWIECVHPDDREHCAEICGGAFELQKPFRLDFRMRRHDGEWRFIHDNAAPRFAEDGTFLGYIGSCVDITERKHVEEALREGEERFRGVFENAGIGMLEIDSDWRILGVNAAYAHISGRSREELSGADCLSFTHPEDRDLSRDAMRGIIEGRTDRASLEKRYLRPDGGTVWIRSNLSRVSTGAGGDRFLKIVEDIDDRKAAEEALREERNRLDTLNRTGTAVSGELDLESVVQLVTDAGVELTGAEFGAFFYNVISADGESYMLYTLSGADRSAFEGFPMPRNTDVFAPTFEGTGTVRSDDITKDPRYGKNQPYHGMPEGHLPVRSYLAVPVFGRSGEVVGGLFFGHSETGRFSEEHERLLIGIAAQAAIAIDNARLYQAVQKANETLEQRVDERTKELEKANEALRQAQKMEAIGQLTGGIAHDFNNMLTVIRGSADILRRPDLDEQRRDKYVQAIADTADRAARLTAQLLAFARRQALKPEVFDAADCVDNISDILRTMLGARVRLYVETAGDDCFVETDAAQFETALVNMAVNARDAMDGEGELHIRIDCPRELPQSLRDLQQGRYVAVSVADTGHGIAPDHLDKIFEPFFTTKETGKGTGLGLSQVYGFAKQSGGEILVESEPGQGTRFTLYLPHAPERGTGSKAEGRSEQLPRGGRVLVVEDNEEVGLFAEQVLGELGFEAQLATSADEALSILGDDDGFDLVFSDVVMPDVGGIDLAREIRDRWPGLPVVLTSGYSHVLASRAEHEFPLLHKPYSLEALSEVLGTALARRGRREPPGE